ncbi:twin-arginine translocation signal domain-containing protein, partial [Mariniphaga sediminis]
MKNINRRNFVKKTALAGAAFTVVPGSVLGKAAGHVSPSDKLNIAGVGIGG